MRKRHQYWVYVLASRRRGALYIGITNDLGRRIFEHRTGVGSIHAERYGIHLLVYFEEYDRVWDAISREKQIKKWRRQWKIDLIESVNPDWSDLYQSLPL